MSGTSICSTKRKEKKEAKHKEKKVKNLFPPLFWQRLEESEQYLSCF